MSLYLTLSPKRMYFRLVIILHKKITAPSFSLWTSGNWTHYLRCLQDMLYDTFFSFVYVKGSFFLIGLFYDIFYYLVLVNIFSCISKRKNIESKVSYFIFITIIPKGIEIMFVSCFVITTKKRKLPITCHCHGFLP